jgi:hypothetical protein
MCRIARKSPVALATRSRVAPPPQATASFPRPPEWCRAPGEARAKSLLERFQQKWQRFCGSETRQRNSGQERKADGAAG